MIDYDKYCKRCSHYQYDQSMGILCGITENTPSFEGNCKSFELDFEKEDELIQAARAKEVMTGGELFGSLICTPYGLFKYFNWKEEYPNKSKQVCVLYLMLIAIPVLLSILSLLIKISSQ